MMIGYRSSSRISHILSIMGYGIPVLLSSSGRRCRILTLGFIRGQYMAILFIATISVMWDMYVCVKISNHATIIGRKDKKLITLANSW